MHQRSRQGRTLETWEVREKGDKAKHLFVKEACQHDQMMWGREREWPLVLAVRLFLVTFDVIVSIEWRVRSQISGDYSENLELG